MSRLQKKCLIASAAAHVLLVCILVFAPAFVWSKKNADNLPVLEFVPAKLVDELMSGGGKPNATPPPVQKLETAEPSPVQPIASKPPEPQPETPPKPAPQPPAVEQPVVKKNPEPVLPVPKEKSKPLKPTKSEPTPSENPRSTKVETQKSRIELNLKQVKRSAKDTAAVKAQVEEEANARKAADTRRALLNSSIKNLAQNLSPGTNIDIPGPGGEAYANYGQIVKSIYDDAWQEPKDVADENATVETTVTIDRDGTVSFSATTRKTGIVALDKSVDAALRRVQATKLPPFPEGTKDAKRTFIINFNLKSKRSSG